ncbi:MULTISPECIES: hydroxyacylglutathione hydrolase [Prochlorococcus]|uniref:Hydroxyacylglutathione hydrolase n=1 Tax=Prochlorococcus marinus (strain SARG / CCMP1375 / SS120) TaxID=167539 RepID=GLO2_PROMA|nr:MULTISPECIES: hydroxyacylglutathione hydrolase [Prochlorococcus]Q7VD23.1 RecName: Full=Hydroxyacylglutathione hydrolase; AltName: Full=Glyoxalase II; Short=Glx II [Prochlorococcus marinus subsp. marinus str. CCMP1375]AAP99606.1 Metallo-beta-lactamase superfamily hydrolase [Prochlorococcus marinus subsp. marinus str. CCMP1375]KGG11124.1 Hydroxyacylglutathione hydrolase [Prochlorococcus marinus str. LG]KGG21462.1 Hydroxyacylglutathione hydrolase [Prochlorococcus marinus str. SS2]KGG23193.1 Hy
MKKKEEGFIIHPIPVLMDNIIWIWVKEKQAIVVDPAISEPVINLLKGNGLSLHSVLQTHHHEDHIGGTQELINVWPSASVIAAKSDLDRIQFQTKSVVDNEELDILGQKIKVIEVPGHTSNHICFFLQGSKESKIDPVLFCGDTLFGAGCGRLFEGTPEQMFNSLSRINNLPKNTKIYCAHEYTEANLRWAKSIFPEDIYIEERLKEVILRKSKGFLSIPSKLSEERKTNLFIRASNQREFAQLRLHKDNWKS